MKKLLIILLSFLLIGVIIANEEYTIDKSKIECTAIITNRDDVIKPIELDSVGTLGNSILNSLSSVMNKVVLSINSKTLHKVGNNILNHVTQTFDFYINKIGFT